MDQKTRNSLFNANAFRHLPFDPNDHEGLGQKLTVWCEQKMVELSEFYSTFVLSCSGGLDSTALVRLFCEKIKIQKRFPTKILHFNFGLRGTDSDGDEDFVAQLAKQNQVELIVVRASEMQLLFPRPKKGVQVWARKIRKKIYSDLKTQENALIMTAHHLDDVCETAMFRMMRGSSFGKLGGMQRFRHDTWRPFIDLEKKQIAQIFSGDFRTDRSNLNTEYRRNFIRHEIMHRLGEKFPRGSRHFYDCIRDAEEVFQYCENMVNDALLRTSYEYVDLAWLTTLPRTVAFVAIEKLLKKAASQHGQKIHITRSLLGRLLKLGNIEKTSKKRLIRISEGLLWEVDSGRGKLVYENVRQKATRQMQHRKFFTRAAEEGFWTNQRIFAKILK